MPDRGLRRHDLLRIAPEDWHAVLGATETLDRLAAEPRRLVENWADRGWPVVVRRPDIHEWAIGIPVGLPLPPSFGKLRLALSIPNAAAAERLSAVALHEASGSLPERLRPQIEAVLALGARVAVAPAVFGAALWQHLTGLTYLHEGSDIDLLWPLHGLRSLPGLLDALSDLDDVGPAGLDGEVVLPTGEGVSWRELRRERGRPGGVVLARSMEGAKLICVRSPFS